MMVRLELIRTYQACGNIRKTRKLGVSRNTVRKWVRRYEAEGDAGLVDKPRRPKHSPRRTPK